MKEKKRSPRRKSSRQIATAGTSERATDSAAVFVGNLPKAEQDALIDASKRYQERAFPPVAKLKRKEDGAGWITCPAGETPDERAATLVRLMNAMGSKSESFVNTVMSIMTDLWGANGSPIERNYNAAIAVLDSIKPENELEAMLALQMVAANDAAIRCASMIGGADTAEHRQLYGNLSNKFMRTFSSQVEALAKLRRGGEQIVRHVHVNEGGQAVIAGTFNHGSQSRVEGGQNGKPEGQSDAAAAAGECAALRSEDKARD